MELLAPKRMVDKVSIRMDEYSEIGHVKRIKEHLLPKLVKFSADIDGLMSDNKNVKQCIM